VTTITTTSRPARPSSPADGEAWSSFRGAHGSEAAVPEECGEAASTGAEHTRVFEHRKRRPNEASGRDRRASLLKQAGDQ
jgi:hypothetical protein